MHRNKVAKQKTLLDNKNDKSEKITVSIHTFVNLYTYLIPKALLGQIEASGCHALSEESYCPVSWPTFRSK